ncbi:MAG: 50S ribosomal protein L4 [Parcubacteria group bacterium]|nr:50S ribosomal protein L4 [Parcubacteria group bacterium]
MELSPKVFGVKVNEALVHQAVITQLANERKVIAHTKDRSEVRGGGRKPWRQKGTGRARHGSSRSPIWIGGGVTFGPRNERNFKKRLNKKMKQNAILMALSDKAANENLVILDKLEMAEFKTKIFNGIISNQENKKIIKAESQKRSILVMVDRADEKIKYSAKNLPGVELINLDNINLVDLLKYKNLVITKGVVEKIEERYK